MPFYPPIVLRGTGRNGTNEWILIWLGLGLDSGWGKGLVLGRVLPRDLLAFDTAIFSGFFFLSLFLLPFLFTISRAALGTLYSRLSYMDIMTYSELGGVY